MADKNKELMDAFRELINEGELTTYEGDQFSISYERQAIENYETNVAERLVALVRKSEEVAELAKDLDQIFNARVERIQSWRELQKDAQKD